jgi:hypothetical protein
MLLANGEKALSPSKPQASACRRKPRGDLSRVVGWIMMSGNRQFQEKENFKTNPTPSAHVERFTVKRRKIIAEISKNSITTHLSSIFCVKLIKIPIFGH